MSNVGNCQLGDIDHGPSRAGIRRRTASLKLPESAHYLDEEAGLRMVAALSSNSPNKREIERQRQLRWAPDAVSSVIVDVRSALDDGSHGWSSLKKTGRPGAILRLESCPASSGAQGRTIATGRLKRARLAGAAQRGWQVPFPVHS